jgi:hypothetical protein
MTWFLVMEVWIDVDLITLEKSLDGHTGRPKAQIIAFFIQFASLANYSSILYGVSMFASRFSISSKLIVSRSDILVASIEMASPTVSPTGSEGKIATVSLFSQPSDSSA